MEMLWGGRWRDVTIVAGSNAMERPMAQQLDDLSRSLTPLEQDSTIIAVIEMSQASWLVAQRGGLAPVVDALACGGNPEGSHDYAHRGRVRGGPRRVLAGALAPGPRYRSLRHPRDQRGCLTRASPGQNRSPRHGIAQTGLHRLAARRTRSLQHGRHCNAGGGGCQAPQP